jgi:hypothetical protein
MKSMGLTAHSPKSRFFGYRKTVFRYVFVRWAALFVRWKAFFACFLAARDHDKSLGFIPLGLVTTAARAIYGENT